MQLRFVVLLLLTVFHASAAAQAFPSKPVRLIVRGLPGSADDMQARLLAPQLSKALGQQVIIDYRSGAGGAVAFDYVAKLPPDGYTLLFAASGLAAIKSLRSDTSLDPWRDFTWVSQVSNFMIAFSVHPALPTKTLKDLVALAKSRPGELSYGSSGIGATPHLAAEYFKSVARIDISHIPYKGSSPLFVDLMAGRIEMATTGIGAALPHAKGGKLRTLAVTGTARSRELPDVPTVAESGYRGFEFTPFYALVAPGGTPREIAATIASAVATAMSPADFREHFIKTAGADPASNTPEQMLQLAKKEAALIEKIVRTANIKPE